jgi:hypothetical protein
MTEKSRTKTPAATIFTLTLPDPGGEGILLIQRGELAHVRQFAYMQVSDITEAVQAAMDALALVESNPPVIPDAPPEGKTTSKAAPPPEPAQPQEPTIDIPVKKGVVTVPISYLKITGGETDASAYRQAVQIAGKLITGGLWDGKTPIHIDDVYRVQRQLKGLSDKEMSLFTLEDFAHRASDVESSTALQAAPNRPDIIGSIGEEDDSLQDVPDDEPAPAALTLSAETLQPDLL